MPKIAPKAPCGPSPIETFMVKLAIAEAINSQNPQRLHRSSATAEITFTTPQPANAQNAQLGVFGPFRRSHSQPKRYIRDKAELMMMANSKYVVRHP
jgi:hypothetical protein